MKHSAALINVNSAALRHALSVTLSNRGMKIVEEVRRLRLEQLVEEFGSYAKINEALGRLRTDSTLSQIANQSIGSKTRKPKSMGSPLARELERACKKATGWMDTDPGLDAPMRATPPAPPADYKDRHQLTPSQFGDFTAAATVLTPKEWDDIRQRYKQVEENYKMLVGDIKGKR